MSSAQGRSWIATLAGGPLDTVLISAAALSVVVSCSTYAGERLGPSESRQTPMLTVSAKVGAAPPTFRATGNEPGWRLDIADNRITLLMDYGQRKIVMPVVAFETTRGSRTYTGRDARHTMTVTVSDQVCVDSMSGMPHPNRVVVVLDGTASQGCGGDPAALLEGVDWVVERINGASLVEGSKVTLSFGPDGRVSGNSSCNTFTGGYSLTGEGLSLSPAARSTRVCEPATMAQESTFLETLAGVNRFEIENGALILRGGDGRAIRARRG